jgi:hypothetical protein
MKIVVGIIALILVGLAAMYFFGGYKELDPDKQGREAKAAITPGMTFKQVIDAAGKPRKARTISVHKRKDGDEWIEDEQIGPLSEFKQNVIEDRLRQNNAPYGFILHYYFSDQVAFEVRFDAQGVVEEIYDVRTMADLLQTRD